MTIRFSVLDIEKKEIGFFSGVEEVIASNFALKHGNNKENVIFSATEELDALAVLTQKNITKEKVELIKIAKETVIPKQGWKYKVKKGETLSHIALKFNVPLKKLLALNNLSTNSLIREGDIIYLPINPNRIAQIRRTSISSIQAKFIEALSPIGEWLTPVTGLNQRMVHSNNGVDISAECGQPVYAANSGIVIESKDGWNGGYGKYIKIQHDDSTITLYGHLSERYVKEGDYVEKGTLIGLVGNTGKTTGCHLHFERRGGKNFLSD